MRHFAVVLPWLLIPVFATASRAASPEQWVQVRATHFVVLTDSSEKDARRIASQFERMHMVFHAIFPTAGDDSDPPIQVLAVKDRKAMQALEPEAYLGRNKLDLSGLFVRTPEKNYILVRLDAGEEHAYATVYHEYTHYMLRKADAWLPLWLNEGLAQFYENTDIDDKEARLGQASAEDVEFLGQNGMLPLTTLLAVDSASPYYHDEQKGSVFYAESWALTHYLIVHDRTGGTHRMHDYTQLLAQGEDSVTAAQHAFGDLNKLQQQLSMYLLQRNFTYFSMKAELAPQQASFDVRPVPAVQADAVRADILIYTDRTRDAQALLDSVLRDDPGNAQAHESMGFLSFRQGDIEAAEHWYGQAVDLDSQSYLAHYYYAAMALHGGARGEDDAIESSLQAAIKLNPEFAPSYDALAMFYGSRHRNLDQAHMLNVHAIELDPGSLNYRLNGAEVLAEGRQFAGAVNILKAAAHLAKTQQEIDSVQSRIQRFESYQAELDRSSSLQPPAGAGN